ncbi:MBL fold metallo-hydrolase [Sediminibacillus massiliensis]|uniref:MBL fold metallo-hydrolase n=1 Tax=Sediminibacillus massiliensis TaxID=1926277 RepID=UPI0009884F1C|nr:MBL fold metallo-hydrolase [Sediminibacillus massiliensis]
MDKDVGKSPEEQLDMEHAETVEVLEDLAYYRTVVANVCMIGHPKTGDWVLIDTGVAHYDKRIVAACEQRFGDRAPKAIILTHGHFDHVGSAKELAKHWDIPIYIHEKEMDYVTGKKSYPPADPTVGGSFLTFISPFFPQKPVNFKKWVTPLPENGAIPFLDDWKYIHTPGHSEGHIVLFREKDRTLITGDAIVTENPDETVALFIPIQGVYGPPPYFTSDWDKAEQSVKKMAELRPEVLLTGHGLPLEGESMREKLQELADNFMEKAIPKNKKH